MQLMLDIVEDFAKRFNISFSTDPNPVKSKSYSHSWEEEGNS